ncbi:MAG: hypothetical protein RR400_02800, partial [Clostridia bacterium]
GGAGKDMGGMASMLSGMGGAGGNPLSAILPSLLKKNTSQKKPEEQSFTAATKNEPSNSKLEGYKIISEIKD